MIEVIDLEELKESEETNPPSFNESQKLALQCYNSRQKYDEKLFQAFMVKNTLKSNQVDARQHPHRNRNSSNRFGDNKLTVENVLYNNNTSSAMSVLAVDNILTSITNTKVKEVISVKTNNILFI